MIWQKKEKGSGIMLHLVLGTDWTKNRDTVLGRIAGDVRQKRPNVVLIVPELITHDMERRLCTAAGDTASRYAEVLSFSRLALRVADSMGCAVEECLDNGGRVVAMAAAARMLASKLKAYAAVETKPEFLTALVDAVDEFKRCCISAADLMVASGQAEGSLHAIGKVAAHNALAFQNQAVVFCVRSEASREKGCTDEYGANMRRNVHKINPPRKNLCKNTVKRIVPQSAGKNNCTE